MMSLNSSSMLRVGTSLTVLLVGVTLAACVAPAGRAQSVHEEAPSVTYKFADDDGLVDATIKAEVYCREYNAWPTNTGMRMDAGGASEVTFVCDQDRTATYAGAQRRSMPGDVTVDYSYRDEQALVDATTQAQRHCARYGAEARSQTVTTGRDGTRTITFECVPLR